MKIYSHHKVFNEIVKGIVYCLKKNNFDYTVVDTINKHDEDLYIILGLNGFTSRNVIPKYYIAVQLEQTGVPQTPWLTNEYYSILNNAIEVWDYSKVNIQNFSNLVSSPIYFIPLSYIPSLTHHDRLRTKKDIDVLFMGALNEKRVNFINKLKNNNINVHVAAYNLWGRKRDAIVARSKILLNIHFYENAILETARLSYILSMGECIVITEKSSDSFLDQSYANYVDFCNSDNAVEMCKKYINMKEDVLKKRIDVIFNLYKMHEFNLEFKTISKFSTNNTILTDIKSYIEPEMVQEEGRLVLPSIEEEDLPFVSILTITKNRKSLFPIAIRNFYEFQYPKHKLEWIILDDGKEDLREILPSNDKRIKYLKHDDISSISQKRDIGIGLCSHDYVMFMDDDDYYFPCSIYARVMLLMKYSKECVGCLSCGIYDIIEDNSFIINSSTMFEASLGFRKNFWNKRKFGNEDNNYGEGYLFTKGRENEIVNMPYFFNLIAITHSKNITKNLRKMTYSDNAVKNSNFFNLWEKDLQLFFLDLIKKSCF
jgi:hypothetical protein